MKLLLLLLLFSCGKQTIDAEVSDSNHTVDGEVHIIIEFNIEQLEAAFKDSCTEEFSSQEDIDACIAAKVANILDLINKTITPETVNE